MRLATVQQAFRIDAETQKAGVSGEALMEAAGALSAREIARRYPGARVAVVAGPGNNGGDARVVARHLDVPVGLRDADVIVDGLFGIGFRDKPAGRFESLIHDMNARGKPIVALDVPSGLDADTGVARGAAVRARETLTFGVAKPGFFVNDGPACVGRLRVLPIGFPADIVRAHAHTHHLFTQARARKLLPARPDSSNKSTHGRLLVCAGSGALWGAGLLTATSAFRAGAGYVTWASFEKPPLLADLPEAFFASLRDETIWQKKNDAIAFGPGLGTGRETADLIERLKSLDTPVVLDADGIEAARLHDLFPLPAHWVITPHAGELGRVLERSAAAIEADRFTAARDAVAKVGCHVLLKGYRTVLASRERYWIIHAGNAALAKAGSGDTLTGFIGALMAQKLSPLAAAATGAYLHGRLADEWVQSGRDKASLLASDLRDLLPPLLARLREGR